MNKQIVGWDVGGAHLKAALIGHDGRILKVLQKPCPLWLGIERLQQAVGEVLRELPAVDLHAITMTGELVDCFASREQGVQAITATMRTLLGATPMLIYAGCAGFLRPEQVGIDQVMNIASANWLASATLAADAQSDALFVDIGSTTTDILLIENHRLLNSGYSDYQRLVSGELLYTGIVRTAVMAVAQTAQFKGRQMGLMAEYFATMADVYRLTGDLHEAHDQSETADGAEKTALASARRLSRMTGYEFDVKDMALWHDFARHLKGRQKQQIKEAGLRQLERRCNATSTTLIGAGVGRFLIRELAEELQLMYRDFAELLPMYAENAEQDAGDCAPAASVACLATRFGE